MTLWWPIISHWPEQGHGTLPTCSEICMAPIRQFLNCSCCLYSCSVPLTPRRAQGLSGKISINQAQTDCYNFTLFLLSFHTFNEFRGLLLSEELLSRPQQKKLIKVIYKKTNTHAHKTDSTRTGSTASKVLLKQTWKSAEGEYGAIQAADSRLLWA